MAIEARNITKRFGDYLALDDVSVEFTVYVPRGVKVDMKTVDYGVFNPMERGEQKGLVNTASNSGTCCAGACGRDAR